MPHGKTKELRVTNIAKSIGPRKIVRDVSLALTPGQVVGLLGPNGAGKTTTFYMIAGIISPDHGEIIMDNMVITHSPIYRRASLGISYLPQESSIFKGLNVEDNIKAVLELHHPQEIIERKLEELLGDFSISHLRSSNTVSLSGGERRRVEIARALATSPEYILLDEPLAGVDPIAINEIKAIIMQLKARGIGILITDHNVREALTIIDYAYIIHEGMVLREGAPKKIIKDEMVKKVYLGQEFNL